MFRRNSLIAIGFGFLFVLIVFLLFKYKPFEPKIIVLDESGFGLYIENNVYDKHQFRLLSKEYDYYLLGHQEFPNFSFKKYKNIIKINKKNMKIKYIDEINQGDLLYDGLCQGLIIFQIFKSEYRKNLNYKNSNYDEKEDESCRDLIEYNKSIKSLKN